MPVIEIHIEFIWQRPLGAEYRRLAQTEPTRVLQLNQYIFDGAYYSSMLCNGLLKIRSGLFVRTIMILFRTEYCTVCQMMLAYHYTLNRSILSSIGIGMTLDRLGGEEIGWGSAVSGESLNLESNSTLAP